MRVAWRRCPIKIIGIFQTTEKTTMFTCRDFVPEQLKAYSKGLPEDLFFLPQNQGTYKSFQDAVTAANQWTKQQKVKVISIETVVLPNIHEKWEEGSQDPAIRTFAKPIWHQFVRVWYDDGK
jgi:hypothetical protein